MNRREFIAAAVTAGAVGASGVSALGSVDSADPFKLKYAPGFRHFKHSAGPDPIDQLKYMHEHGFRAIEDNGMMKKDPALQQKIGDELARLDMTMGVFVLGFGMNTLLLTSNLMDEKMRGQPAPAAVKSRAW